MALEYLAVCPICGSGQFGHLIDCQDYTVSNEVFQLQQCAGCQFVVTNPRPDVQSINKYYQSDDYISHTGGTGSILDFVYKKARVFTNRNKNRTVEKYQSQGNILDIGCGTGELLNTFSATKWRKYGVEPSPTAFAKIPEGIEKQRELSSIHQSFDVITLWHVLEHIHQLNEYLEKINSLLKKNGTLFIAVPNYESEDAKHYKNMWAAYDVPRHLWHFSKKSITNLMAKNHFKLMEIQPMKLDSYYVSLLSEKYLQKPLLSQLMNGTIQGLRSNLKAKKDNYSSLLYIFCPC